MRMPEEKCSGYIANTLLNNSGGPRSRTRTEVVHSSMLLEEKMYSSIETIGIQIPDEIYDISEWLQKILELHGLRDWIEAEKNFMLPKYKMIVSSIDDKIITDLSTADFIRSVMILSRSNTFRYMPEGPQIFTRSRLNRSIKLIKLNNNYFYGLE